MNFEKSAPTGPTERFNRATRRSRPQAQHDAAARLAGRTGWIIQHSHPCRHVLRGLMSISRARKSLGSKTQATSRLLHIDLVTARMLIQDAPMVRKHRGPALELVAEAERIEAQRAEGPNEAAQRYSGRGMVPSRRDRRIAHAKAAKASAAIAAATVNP